MSGRFDFKGVPTAHGYELMLWTAARLAQSDEHFQTSADKVYAEALLKDFHNEAGDCYERTLFHTPNREHNGHDHELAAGAASLVSRLCLASFVPAHTPSAQPYQ